MRGLSQGHAKGADREQRDERVDAGTFHGRSPSCGVAPVLDI